MAATRIALAGIVVTIGMLATSRIADAASYQHLDTLAVSLQRDSARLYHEFRLHFRHTPGYTHLMSDAASMYRLARHVHEVAHHHGSIAHLRSDLRKLDHTFHHLEGLVDRIERGAYHHGVGHIHGDTRHVRRMLHVMDTNLHHLRADVNELGHGGHYIGTGYGHGVVPGHGGHAGHAGHRGAGVSFGGRRITFRLGH